MVTKRQSGKTNEPVEVSMERAIKRLYVPFERIIPREKRKEIREFSTYVRGTEEMLPRRDRGNCYRVKAFYENI